MTVRRASGRVETSGDEVAERLGGLVVQELVHAHPHERADGVHDHLGAEFGISVVSGAADDQPHVATLVLGELLERGLEQTRLLLDHGEHRRSILDRVEQLEAADRQLNEVVEQVAVLRGELLSRASWRESMVANPKTAFSLLSK